MMRDFITMEDVAAAGSEKAAIRMGDSRIDELWQRSGGCNVSNSRFILSRDEQFNGWHLEVVFLSSGWTGIEART